MAALAGRTAVITGAGRGIGASAAEAMAAEGAALVLLARRSGDVEAVAARLRDDGADVMAEACDVSDYASFDALVGRARQRFGSVDVLVNNAAVIDPITPLSAADPAAWAKAIEINVTGVFNGIRAVLPAMRAAGRGVILTIGSGAAHNPLEGWSAYCSAKAAAYMLTRCTHLENRGHGIRAISLSPGTIATDMQRAIRASGINPVSQMDFAAHAPPEDPARALVWLCSDDAAEFGGQEVSLKDPAIRERIGLGPRG